MHTATSLASPFELDVELLEKIPEQIVDEMKQSENKARIFMNYEFGTGVAG